jgi:hypothetical protein
MKLDMLLIVSDETKVWCRVFVGSWARNLGLATTFTFKNLKEDMIFYYLYKG